MQQKTPATCLSTAARLIFDHIARNSIKLKLAEHGIDALRDRVLIVVRGMMPGEKTSSFWLIYPDGRESGAKPKFFIVRNGETEIREFRPENIKLTETAYLIASPAKGFSMAVASELGFNLAVRSKTPVIGNDNGSLTIEDGFSQKSITLFTAITS